MNLKPNHTVYQGSQKTQTYRLIRIYEKEEFGETCIRCELVLGKRLLRRYEVDSFDDLFKWEFQNKFFNSFGWFDFDRRKFERKHGMVEWLKIFLGKYDLKFVYQQLKIETGDLPNFKALYLEPLRVNIIARHRFNEYLKSFLGWKKF